MDKTSFMILLVTGFSTTSESVMYYMYSDLKTWNEALSYCTLNHLNLLQDFDHFNSSSIQPTSQTVDDPKAWIGIYETSTIRYWVGGGIEIYSNWSFGEPSGGKSGLCVSMTDVGDWYENNCSDLKQSVCSNGTYFTIETKMSWNDADTNCQEKRSFLVTILDNVTNAEIKNLLPSNTQVWIGLFKSTLWFSSTGYITQTNWRKGQPDNFYKNEYCAAMMSDGTWADEPCDDLYPFICRDVDKSKERIIKLKIQTMANLEDLVATASLTKQLRKMLSKRGVNEFKLFWKKLPVKESDQKGTS